MNMTTDTEKELRKQLANTKNILFYLFGATGDMIAEGFVGEGFKCHLGITLGAVREGAALALQGKPPARSGVRYCVICTNEITGDVSVMGDYDDEQEAAEDRDTWAQTIDGGDTPREDWEWSEGQLKIGDEVYKVATIRPPTEG